MKTYETITDLIGSTPLLELNQIGFLDSGAAFEYSVSRNVGDRFELHNVTLA